MSLGAKKRKFLQVICVIIFIAYLSLLGYQSYLSGSGAEDKIKGLSKRSHKYDILGEVTRIPLKSSLGDIFISVKTTKKYHHNRLNVILKTWFQLAKNQTWFFTDGDDPSFQKSSDGHLINTNCPSSHSKEALCCKMSMEYDTFLSTNKKWFCHFDDDNYVNVPYLVEFLGYYDSREEWYLGKPSIPTPLEISHRDNTTKVKFWFATGGAGFCLSRALALRMVPVAGNGRFISIGKKINMPDDVTMGYIIEYLMKKPLTVVDQFHSHLEPLKPIAKEELKYQISFSYRQQYYNVVKIDGFNEKIDPYRFFSLHCFLFSRTNFCRAKKKTKDINSK